MTTKIYELGQTLLGEKNYTIGYESVIITNT